MRTLSENERAQLGAHIEPATLARVRLRRLPWPVTWLLAFVAGLTLGRTVFVSRRGLREAPLPLLFHELVHVVQYERLGLVRFLWRYARGWAAHGFHYRAIPLEAHAHELQRRFEAERGQPFSVRAEVEARLTTY